MIILHESLRIELSTPVFAVRQAFVVRHITDCTTRLGLFWVLNFSIFLLQPQKMYSAIQSSQQ